MAKIRLEQVKSEIDRPAIQRNTLIALGIRRIGQSVVKEATPQILGMVAKVKHMLKVENVA